MKKNLLLLSLSLLFAACGTSEEEDSEIQKLNDTYHFKDITYTLEETDFVKPVENWHEYILTQNWSDKYVDAVFHPYQNEEDYSVFHGFENIPYTIYQEEPILVKVPERVAMNKIFIGSEKHNLLAKETFPSTRVSRTKEIIKLPPLCGIEANHNEVMELFHITFIATFVGEKYENEIMIKGTWEGKYHYGCRSAQLTAYELQSQEP